MGLPVWRPSSPDVHKNATRRDPTASSRSAIRRRRSVEISSSSHSNPFPANRADIGEYLNRRRRDQERRANVNETRLRASELREARQNLRSTGLENDSIETLEVLRAQTRLHAQRAENISALNIAAGRRSHPWRDDTPPAETETLRSPPPRRTRPSAQLQRRIDRLPELSRDLPSPSASAAPGMLDETRELRVQIERLRETLQRHQAADASRRATAAPWLEPDRQLHSSDPSDPVSALHENRPQLSALRALLYEVEREFRDPTPHDVEEQFRLSVRARYADNPAENPYHGAPHRGWDEDRISDFWNAELARRLLPTENTPIGVAAHQVLMARGYYVEGRRRDSLSPSSSESSGGPVSASLSSPPRRGLRRYAFGHPVHVSRNGVSSRSARMSPYASAGSSGEAPWRFRSRVVQSPPSYISAGGIDGLGDRELSLGPGDAEEEETWAVMQTTVTPDDTLPSADSSFTSAAASASFSTSSTPTDNTIPSLSLPGEPASGTKPGEPTLNPANAETLPTSSDPLPSPKDPNPVPIEPGAPTTTFAPSADEPPAAKALEKELEEKKTPFWKKLFQSPKHKKEEKAEKERLEKELRNKRRASRSEVYGMFKQ
ncbi:hypothetical protein FKW77_003969 [Venturia effusa]|uniref:Uncharacterized protein n=1 Tax=Venturia effusa TaxID=50376 RepID=A0A517LLF5_9PEZI|nr:hypothetical protein FKW77_003969 [Venturia effusa]